MALDDKTLGKFVELLNNLSQAFGANLSQLLNVEVSMNFDGLMDPMIVDGDYNIANQAISVFADINNSESGSIAYIADVNDAIVIADLMAGGNGDVTGKSFEAIEQAAFSESLAQSTLAIIHKLKTLVIGLDVELSDFQNVLIDPANPDSLKHDLVQTEYTSFAFNVQVTNVVNSSFYLNLADVFIERVVTLADVKNPKLANKNSVSEVEFAQMNHTVNTAEIYEKKNLNLLLDIKLGLIVELGRSEMQLRDILKLTKGSVIELDRLSGEPVDLFVNNKIIARGEVVVIDDSFGLRITQLAGNIELSSELGLTVGA
ncbi:MAG: flagellar motor switch protein FliN [Candidatus Melainabacteria bacterium]|nr:flagellar motor switch protein FliN [Candidatus Melainabacteria bacterium]